MIPTRERIIEATLTLVGQHGLAGVTMVAVAKTAGVARATLYNHYPDIPSILADAANVHDQHAIDGLHRTLGVVSTPPRAVEQLARYVASISSQGHTPFAHRFISSDKHHQPSAFDNELEHQIRSILASGITSGDFRSNLDVAATATMLRHALNGVSELVAASPERSAPIADDAIATLLAAITAPNPGSAMPWNIEGKDVLITGGTSGIGRATATQLSRLGARVTITSRTLAAAQLAAGQLTRESRNLVEPAQLDLSSLDAVRTFATAYAERRNRLDVLVNNAGTMAGERRTTSEGFEWTLAVNHLGPFLLTNLLTPLLIESAPARVITVSSESHRSAKRGLDFDDLQMDNGYSSSKAYAASKLANILFTVELDRRIGPHGVTARSLHPGVVATNFGKDPNSPRWMGLAMTLLRPFLASADKGAATSVHLATAQSDEIGTDIYWASNEPRQPSGSALDTNAARRLWDISAGLVHAAT